MERYHIGKVIAWVGGLLLYASVPVTGLTDEAEASAAEYSKVTYVYKQVGDHEVLADVYSRASAIPRPAVIWIHGGGLIFGTRAWIPQGQLDRYLDAGYAVVAIDHRLAPETKLAEIFEDLEDAYRWIRSEGPALFPVDPDRIAFVGHSSGGYLALLAGARLSPAPRAAVSLYGCGDVTGDWTTLPNPDFLRQPAIARADALAVVGQEAISSGAIQYSPKKRPLFFNYCKQQGTWTEEVSGRDPKRDASWLAAYEPRSLITSAYPPTFLIHGGKDTDVPIEQSILMAETLERRGVPHRLLTNPDWEHLFDLNAPADPEVQDALDQIAQFLQERL